MSKFKMQNDKNFWKKQTNLDLQKSVNSVTNPKTEKAFIKELNYLATK